MERGSSPSTISRAWSGPLRDGVHGQRVAPGCKTDRAVDSAVATGWIGTTPMRALSRRLVGGVALSRSLSGGPTVPSTGVEELVVGKLGMPELGGSYFPLPPRKLHVWTSSSASGRRAGSTGPRCVDVCSARRDRPQPARDRQHGFTRAVPSPTSLVPAPFRRPGEGTRGPPGVVHHALTLTSNVACCWP